MRVGFAGTPTFAARALRAIHEAGYTIPLVLTQPDRPHGRGLRLAPSPVKAYALEHDLPVAQPPSLRAADARAGVVGVPLDVLVVAAYGLILPPEVLAWPREGCVNIHASLLPRWRGAAPIARAIEAGDATTGITIMQMDEGLDTGPMIAATEVTIEAADTAGSLEERLAETGATAIVATLARLAAEGTLRAAPQPAEGATYAAKIRREEAAVDWRRPPDVLHRQIRALDPSPGAFAILDGAVVKLAGPTVAPAGAPLAPGTLAPSSQGVDVACGADGTGRLRIGSLKPAGSRWMDGASFARGRALGRGSAFSLPGG
jgi:methionyl-tRNA formyltransferase